MLTVKRRPRFLPGLHFLVRGSLVKDVTPGQKILMRRDKKAMPLCNPQDCANPQVKRINLLPAQASICTHSNFLNP
jgi:hypothetical protein